jgi:hypothetical protein
VPPCDITLVSPTGGEAWQHGSENEIGWSCGRGQHLGYGHEKVNIELYKGGSFYQTIASNTIGHSLSNEYVYLYRWTVPASVGIGDDYEIKIVSAGNSDDSDFSDDHFSILEGIHITSPEEGENLHPGQTVTITWETDFTSTSYLSIYYVKESEGLDERHYIKGGYTGIFGGSFDWTIPQNIAAGIDYKIVIFKGYFDDEYYFSNGYFSVGDTLTVIKDGAGDGTVRSNPSGIYCGSNCGGGFSLGDTVTLTASPAEGSVFAGWSGVCTGAGQCVVTMDEAKSVIAVFNLQMFALSVTKNGTGSGSVTGSIPGLDCGNDCGDDYPYGTRLTLYADPDPGSVFSGWSGDCTPQAGGGCWAYMDTARSVTASFDIVLTVQKTGIGAGTVTSDPPGLDCGDDCIGAYDINTVVTLTPTAGSGSVFSGWSGEDDCLDGVVTLNVSKTCTAAFDLAGGWEARYNGPGNDSDAAFDIAVDNNGDVYVAGRSEDDYITVKYDSSGSQVWEVRYNGPGNDVDRATALAVDDSGNVYVTGYSKGQSTYDFATVKYSQTDSNGDGIPDQAVEEWVARYDDGRDKAYDIVVDNNGDIYVTGESGRDYATVKYNTNGDVQWVARYSNVGDEPFAVNSDKPLALAVDPAGNVYVTGESRCLSGIACMFDIYTQYATVKYSQADTDDDGVPDTAVEEWVKRYGPENGRNKATDISLDGDSNVYITGSITTVKYDTAGNELWAAGNNEGYSGNAIYVDAIGNVYVAGVGNDDYATIKYSQSDSDGDGITDLAVEEWAAGYNGPADGYDSAADLAVDSNGYVCVTGRSENDYATVKYDSGGNQVWEARYNGTGNGTDIAHALALGTDGIIYVTGGSAGTDSLNDIVTIKYTAPPFVLTVIKEGTGSGTITSSDSGINCGTDCREDYLSAAGIILEATEDTGSIFAGWSGDPDCLDEKVIMNASRTCTATFSSCLETFYRDTDKDDYGDPDDSIQACTRPEGYVEDNNDCDDGNSAIYPGAQELCDGNINNCNDHGVDDGSGENWYGQVTNCGTGVCSSTGQRKCQNGEEVNTCTSGMPAENLEATCDDSLDNDCDGKTDEADNNCHIYHPSDKDNNWEIGDFELLDAIDDWAIDMLDDFDLLDLIDYWAAGCYNWDYAAGGHKAGCQV